MAERKSTDDGVNVDDAKQVIEDLETADAVDAYTEDDERVGVQKAAKARKEELAESGSDEEPDTEETADEEEAVIVVARGAIQKVHEAVANNVDHAKNKTTGKLKDIDAQLAEAQVALGKLAEANEDAQIAASDFADLLAAVKAKKQELQQMRGMQQPTPLEDQLGASVEMLEEAAGDEEPEG